MSTIKVLFIYVCGNKHRQGPEVVGYLVNLKSLPPHRIWPCFHFSYILCYQFRSFHMCFMLIDFSYDPASTRVSPNDGLMLGQRRRRRPSIKP